MIRINNVHIPLDYSDEIISNKAAKELRIDKNAIKSVSTFTLLSKCQVLFIQERTNPSFSPVQVLALGYQADLA